MQKLVFCFAVALVFVQAQLIIADYVRSYASTVMEVWAMLDQEAYTNYVRGYATSTPEEPAVVMERIAKCESSGKQVDAKGVLIMHVNKDGSVEIGRWMINNKRHEANAVKLGMNIYTEEGNTAYAYHLYDTQGTEPWIHSKPCWVR